MGSVLDDEKLTNIFINKHHQISYQFLAAHCSCIAKFDYCHDMLSVCLSICRLSFAIRVCQVGSLNFH